jgi:hypothetical protein
MYAPELQPYNYKWQKEVEGVLMVGWIDASHLYNTGQVEQAVIDKLWTMTKIRTPTLDLHVNIIRGIHPCTLCFKEIRIAGVTGRPLYLGMSELWVPYRSSWLAAPSLLVHFIDEHGYLPPAEMLNAIRDFDLNSRTISQDVYDHIVRQMAAKRVS